MSPNDLITKVQFFVYIVRRGQMEKVLAVFTISLGSVGEYLCREQDFPLATNSAFFAYGLCAISAIWLVLRIWKQAAAPPAPAGVPMSSAIKGLFPFTVADGKLFARLGRRVELQSLLALAQNAQVGVSVVRGESGVGKTSLLQAGLAYTLGEGAFVYWEAVPVNAPEAPLHSSIRNVLPGIRALESVPEACPAGCVLILDQFEQLRASATAHASIFVLVKRVAKAFASHKLSIIVGFRREYAADWLDFEESSGFRAEPISINLLAPQYCVRELL